MKKKTIEKIPFLTLPKVSKKKKVEYVAVTAMREIRDETCLFIEVYRNRKECREIPVVRIAMTEQDFGTYFTETNTWSGERITKTKWSSYGLIWREDDERISTAVNIMAQENIIYSPEDLKRIQKFTKVELWNSSEWWEYIDQRQKDITSEKYRKKERRRFERRQQALEERQRQTPELPETRILAYADTVIFHNRHTLFYRKHGTRAAIACSKCGGVTDARWKQGQSYESQFEKMIEEPAANHYGICPLCRETGLFVPQGHAERKKKAVGCLFLGQQYKETGFVLRYIQVEKEWRLEEFCGEKGLEMTGAYEKLLGVEIARVYFELGKKVQRDYNKHNPYSGKDYWDDCNLYGLNNIIIKSGKIMPETFEEMGNTFLRYSAMKEYCKAEKGDINPVDYLERYMQTPQIEMLVKMGLTRVVEELVSRHYGIVVNQYAKRADQFLGIRKERVKQLINKQGEMEILKIMQMEKRMGQRWTDEQMEQLAELMLGYEINVPLEYMGIQKLLNRVAKYAGCEYGTMCGTASARLHQIAQTYIDYLNMRKSLGYDLQNTVYLFPRNLEAAHNKMVMEQNRKQEGKRIQEVNEKYQLIKKHYRRLRKKFFFEDEEFTIRPPRDAGEIVMEGRILHHCVGGDNYLSKHNKDQSTILFLRYKSEPEIPYITVEIETNSLSILQWYGAYDKKPDEDRVQRWLDTYIARLKCRRDGTCQDAAEETAQRILMPAM